MARRVCIALVLCAVVAALGMTPALGQEPQPGSGDRPAAGAGGPLAAMAPWFIDRVHTSHDVGRHVSVAVDPGTGMTFISYHDRASGGCLRLARHVGPGGNCGPDSTWQCQILDSFGTVGEYNDVATYPSGNGVRVVISYYDFTFGSLKVIDGYAEASSFTYDTHILDSGNPADYYKGMHTSVEFDSGGDPHIAYQFTSGATHEVQMYASWVGDGTGNCGEGAVAKDWQCDSIYSDEGVGMYASLDLDGDDDPSIAFYDAGHAYPMIAQYVGSGGNCGPGNSWLCRRVHQPTLDTGKYLSLYVEDNGQPHMAYHNATSGTLEYAHYVGSGGNCGFSSASMQWEWQCDEIDDTGSSLTSMGVAVAEDGAGYPVIAYQDCSPDVDPAALRVARPVAAMDANTVPNCGPQDLFQTWRCDAIDGGGPWVDEAAAVSLAVNPAGLATIAYHELNSYPYPVEGNLKIAYQRLPVFLPLVVRN